MYSRQTTDGRHSRSLSIPANYSGSAFRGNEADDTNIETVPNIYDDVPTAENGESAPVSAPVTARTDRREHESAGIFRLFGGSSGGIGFEELLILGLIFLISQNDSGDDLAFLLLLLLFIK